MDYLKINCLSLNCLATIGAIVGGLAIAVYFILKIQRNIKRKSYPKNTVILHQIPRCLRVPSGSPFCLKLETWLRMAKIPYQNDFTFELSSKSQTPWITYNGFDIGDSQYSIEFLSKKFSIDLNSELDDKQKAIGRSVLMLLDGSLRWCMVLHRFVYTTDIKSAPFNRITMIYIKYRTKKMAYEQGYGRHTQEEIYNIGKADLNALNEIIGNNKYLLGDKPSDIDAATFAQLVQFTHNDTYIFNEFVKRSCPNILRYVENLKRTFWTDWNENLKKK